MSAAALEIAHIPLCTRIWAVKLRASEPYFKFNALGRICKRRRTESREGDHFQLKPRCNATQHHGVTYLYFNSCPIIQEVTGLRGYFSLRRQGRGRRLHKDGYCNI